MAIMIYVALYDPYWPGVRPTSASWALQVVRTAPVLRSSVVTVPWDPPLLVGSPGGQDGSSPQIQRGDGALGPTSARGLSRWSERLQSSDPAW